MDQRRSLDVYKIVLYRQDDGSWVAEVPAIIVTSDLGARIRFYGAPSGYEFMSLIEAILLASKGESGLSEDSRALVAAVDRPTAIKVFVTPT